MFFIPIHFSLQQVINISIIFFYNYNYVIPGFLIYTFFLQFFISNCRAECSKKNIECTRWTLGGNSFSVFFFFFSSFENSLLQI